MSPCSNAPARTDSTAPFAAGSPRARARERSTPDASDPCKARRVPWVRAILRGQKVYARADAGGALHVENGRVEIRYKPNDGRRYEARADNLEIADPALLPEETCGAAGPVAKPDP